MAANAATIATSDAQMPTTATSRCATTASFFRSQNAVLTSIVSKIRPARTSFPTVASIPRTSANRLTNSDCAPVPFPESVVNVPASQTAAARSASGKNASDTVLYLAYGSNLCAETLLGFRGIRPLSQVNVSAPSLRLAFDLPGFPYHEPCFANTALRSFSAIPPVPPTWPLLPQNGKMSAHGDPVWSGGLIGVVYEVTSSDYARILATEGGGASYQEIAVPCFPLTALLSEHPPAVSKPFLARTLFAPRLADRPVDQNEKAPCWWTRLLLPARRPDREYAQPSQRYLDLIVRGAREHDLPEDYQRWLGELTPYRRTTLRQKVAHLLFMIAFFPSFLLIIQCSRVLADQKTGKVPRWLAGLMMVLFNVTWIGYDSVGKQLFGDGERTEKQPRVSAPESWSRKDSVLVDEKRKILLSQADA